MRLAVSALILTVLLAALPAVAADCLQEHAIYSDVAGAYELRFEPVGSENAATSNHFKIKIAKFDLMLDGVVMRYIEPMNAHGTIMHNCPEGDVTGADIAACTIWEGTVNAMSADGYLNSLPEEGMDAAGRLLLPYFGKAVRNSSIRAKAMVVPSDILTLKGCAP